MGHINAKIFYLLKENTETGIFTALSSAGERLKDKK